ncbi:MAG: hypothetical protein N4A35_16625 [Flavobacteriales bacterium]|jgi:hypothetical protein|nr:hypothetical protein [Flavobacteriales bacterium]
MFKVILSLILTTLFLNFSAQRIRFDLIQQALNAPQFVTHYNQQTAFNKDKPLTIYLDSSLIYQEQYTFNQKQLEYYDITDPINRMSPSYNFIFSKLSFGSTQAQIAYTFFPNWLVQFNGTSYPNYNNTTVIKVDCQLVKKDNKWTISQTKITDIYFPDWMYEKGSGFEYISNHYIPLKP